MCMSYKHVAMKALLTVSMCLPVAAHAGAFLSGDLATPKRAVKLNHRFSTVAEWRTEAVDATIDVRDFIILVEAKSALPAYEWILRNPENGRTMDASILSIDSTTTAIVFHDFIIDKGFSTFDLRISNPSKQKFSKQQLRFTLCAPEAGERTTCKAAFKKIEPTLGDHRLRLKPEELETGEEVPYNTTSDVTRWVLVR